MEKAEAEWAGLFYLKDDTRNKNELLAKKE